ncbi:MAG: hypothetical protein WCF16_12065 [Alphaproteobacteria bacterium]
MRKLKTQLVLVPVLAAFLGLGSGAALAGNTVVSGSMDQTYSERHMLPVSNDEGHALLLTDAIGKNVDTSGTGFLNGYAVDVREIADLARGTGPSQGYVTFIDGSDKAFVKVNGQVTTVLKDDKPSTAFQGKWSYVGGSGKYEKLTGDGTYAGYFTAEDKFHVDWKGYSNMVRGEVSAK